MAQTRQINLTTEEQVKNFDNAAEAVCDEFGVEVSTGRGRPGRNEISLGEVVNELATAYTGHDVGEGNDG